MFQSDEAFLSDHWSELLFNNVDKIETSERMNLVTDAQVFGQVGAVTRFIHSIDNDQALSGVVVEVLCMTPATGVGFAVPSGR